MANFIFFRGYLWFIITWLRLVYLLLCILMASVLRNLVLSSDEHICVIMYEVVKLNIDIKMEY